MQVLICLRLRKQFYLKKLLRIDLSFAETSQLFYFSSQPYLSTNFSRDLYSRDNFIGEYPILASVAKTFQPSAYRTTSKLRNVSTIWIYHLEFYFANCKCVRNIYVDPEKLASLAFNFKPHYICQVYNFQSFILIFTL